MVFIVSDRLWNSIDMFGLSSDGELRVDLEYSMALTLVSGGFCSCCLMLFAGLWMCGISFTTHQHCLLWFYLVLCGLFVCSCLSFVLGSSSFSFASLGSLRKSFFGGWVDLSFLSSTVNKTLNVTQRNHYQMSKQQARTANQCLSNGSKKHY